MKTYRIETERLVIRCYEPIDAEMLKKTIDESIDYLLPWMPWAAHEPESIEDKTERLRKFRGQYDLDQDFVFGIFDKEEKNLIGSTGLHTRVGMDAREIGYWIGVNYINQGYVTESTQALVKIGFEIENLDRIVINCDPENHASANVPRKLGFTHEYTIKDRLVNAEGDRRDTMSWNMFQSEYQKTNLSQINLKAFDVVGKEIFSN